MATKFTELIKELSNSNVHIKNPSEVNSLIGRLIEGGPQKLQVLFDFDRTLTKHYEEGRKYVSSFDIFSHCKSARDDYVRTVNELKAKYLPIEHNPHISQEDKVQDMMDWWVLSEKALKGLKVTRKEIEEVIKEIGPSLRNGTKEVFDDLNAASVPILVFSSGLGDVVEASLHHFDILLPGVKVVSNFVKYNENGEILGFTDGIIHVFNKNEYALNGTPYYDLVKDRDNVILVGDSLGDAKMADGMDHCNAVLKIGFLNEHAQENLENYMNTFHIVLENDITMDVLRAILKLIL